MNITAHKSIALIVAAIALLQATVALADPMQDLQQRFKERYPQIQQLKTSGKIGETSQGFVDWVKSVDEQFTQLVSTENADRAELYRLIAQKEQTTPDIVGQRNAKRNFDRAKPGEFLKGPDGAWSRKS